MKEAGRSDIMKNNLIFKNFIIIISIAALLNGSFFINSKSDEDFKDKYGVQLVLAK